MEMKPLVYWIDDKYLGKRKVCGFAIKSDLPVRICIHLNEAGYWVPDHFDSGFRYGDSLDSTCTTTEDAAYYAIARMESAIWDDKFIRACIKEGFDMETIDSFTRP